MDGGDFPAVKPEKFSDPLVRLEKSYPFYRMHISNLRQLIYSIGKSEFTIYDLKDKL